MGFEFLLLGIYFIWSIFYLTKNQHNSFQITGVGLLILGYFAGGIKVGDVYFNILNFLGLVSLIIYGLIKSEIDIKNSLCGGVLIAIVYMLINFIMVDFNMFFGVVSFIVIGLLVNFINMFSTSECIVSTVSAIFMCEIFNTFFMYDKLGYVALFQTNIVNCIVVCIGVKILLNMFTKSVGKVKYEKIN